LICYTDLTKTLAALTLIVPAIPPDLWIVFITAIRFLPLLPPRFAPASITAIGLSSVAGPSDEEHLPTLDQTAE